MNHAGISNCPYCGYEIKDTELYHAEDPENTPSLVGYQETASLSDTVTFSTEERIVLRPCNHSFPRDKLKNLRELLQKRSKYRRIFENPANSFDAIIAECEIRETDKKIDEAVDQACALVETKEEKVRQ